VEHSLEGAIFPTWPSTPYVDEVGRWVPGGDLYLSPMAGYPAEANPALRQLADEALGTADAEERVSLFEDALRQVNQSGPWYPLLNPPQVFVSTSDVQPAKYSPIWIMDLADIRPAAS